MPAVPVVRPLRVRTREEAEAGRKVTWLELFFDLVFVGAVAQVAAPLGSDLSPAGLLRFTVLFLLVWWAWLGHTTFSTRFDTDDLVQRTLTLAQMFLAAVMAVNAKEALDSRESAGLAAAYASMRFVLVLQYARARGLPASRPLSTYYLVGCAAAATLWLASAALPAPGRFWLWAVAFLVDFGTPLLAERHSVSLPPDASHLPERYGLFTIILLGEAVVAVIEGMESQAGWSVAAALSAVLSLALLFALWWWYFDGVRGAAERFTRSPREAVLLRIWSYAHLPLYLAIAVMGVGLEHVIKGGGAIPLHGAEPWLVSGAIGLAMVAVSVIAAASHEVEQARGARRRLAAGLAGAALATGLGAAGTAIPPVGLVALLTGLMTGQVALGGRQVPSEESLIVETP